MLKLSTQLGRPRTPYSRGYRPNALKIDRATACFDLNRPCLMWPGAFRVLVLDWRIRTYGHWEEFNECRYKNRVLRQRPQRRSPFWWSRWNSAHTFPLEGVIHFDADEPWSLYADEGNEQMNGWKNDRIDECVDGRPHKWMNRWMDGWRRCSIDASCFTKTLDIRY